MDRNSLTRKSANQSRDLQQLELEKPCFIANFPDICLPFICGSSPFWRGANALPVGDPFNKPARILAIQVTIFIPSRFAVDHID